nr:ephrin type-A receptor 4-A-like [Penaeus vannamei]
MKVDCTKDNNFHHWKKARRCMIGYGVEVVMAGVVSAGGSSSKGRRPLGAPRGTSSSGSPRSCSFPVGGGLPSRAFMRPSLLALFLLTALALASAEQVVLLDTTTESSLEWTRYPFGPNSPTPGWVEESFTQFENGINWRSYVVCDVAYNNVNNWLWTPFIERGPANRMYIEVKFSMRDCSLFPGTALSCEYVTHAFPVNCESRVVAGALKVRVAEVGSSRPRVWKNVDATKSCCFVVHFQGLHPHKELFVCREISLPPSSAVGVQLLQQASFPLFSSQLSVRSKPKVKRQEVANKTDTDFWQDLLIPKHRNGDVMEVCPPGKFKDAVGASACRACPDYSAAPHAGATECRCDTGYYRALKDPRSMPCTRPPSKPQNVTANVLDQSTVILSWQPPVNDGGRIDILYRVICDACSNLVSYNPPQVAEESYNTTQVTISGLYPVTTYRFQVFAENGVSDQGRDPQYVDITVTTEASVPAMVGNVHVTSVKSTEISLAWDAPNDPDNEIEMYEVRYFVRGMESNSSSLLATKEESSVGALRQRTEYGFQVRAKTANGFGDYSPPIYKMTGQLLSPAYVGDEDNTQVRIIVGATVGAFVVIAVIIGMTLLFLRRGTDECNKKQPSDCDTLEYRNGEVHGVLENPPIVQTHITGSMTTPLFTQVGHHRTYIDPHTYEDPNQAIREFAREIDASYITIEAIIGGGEFGDVCKGKLQLPSRPEMTVAIKTLKPGSSEKARVDFLTEASIMGQFEHPNVIFLQGVVTKSNPVMIITEYMENGSLDHFLRVNDGKFQVLQLVGMLRCIASGMQYLSEMNYVHRDLAARNVLVNAQLICKIADFGLSREIESHTEGAYTTRGGKIPVRWTAPEAIAFRKFTSASDVWSLGIVMWEVMSYGERPYWNWSNQDVIKSIEKGYRLPAPMECPEAIYQLMLDCWQKERNHRPNFASIVRTLDRLIRTPEALNKVAQNRCTTALGLDSVDMTQLTSVEDWLASIKMTRYLDNFQRTGLTDLEAVARLTQHDLTQLGITLVGHQKKILQSIHTMRTQLAVNMSEGFLV